MGSMGHVSFGWLTPTLSYAMASNVASVRALVRAGFGVGDLPTFLLEAQDRAQLVSARVPHDPDCGLYLVWGTGWQGRRADEMRTALSASLRATLDAHASGDQKRVTAKRARSTRSARRRPAPPRS